MLFQGIGLDQQSRCCHYHSALDIVSLKCGMCQAYYACYKCHDAMETHSFEPTRASEPFPVLCGVCLRFLSLSDYKSSACPYCQSAFNPNCQRHANIYFT
ncbi:CHY zinc finger protein [Streptococcus pluranimalium]|uniref:CHY zinc finger protein n=1 Tax=Streptococcus pluranimalium TaxID=82348 RepID=UPI0039FCD106